jgi:hypothetical protein
VLPLVGCSGGGDAAAEVRRVAVAEAVHGRGSHSSTVWLNVSAFCGIGGAFRCFKGVSGGGRMYQG